MRVNLHEIAARPQEIEVTSLEPWVATALDRVDEVPLKQERPFKAHFSFHHADAVYILQGFIQTKIGLLCSRCGEPFSVAVNNSISSLYSTDPQIAGVAFLAGKAQKPQQQNHGYARHAHDFEADETELQLGKSDLDITYLNEDYIDLGVLVTEQVQIQVPFQPLCQVECKGLCAHCGTNLNLGRCACDRIKRDNPFGVLNMKEQESHGSS